jgi:hypothetical protein
MPIYEYRCPNGHEFEEFFASFSEARPYEDTIVCQLSEECNEIAIRAFLTPPLEAMMYGNPEGYGKPSATKRHNTKLVSQIEGNKNAVG